MIRTTAYFYDGKSSKPHDVNLEVYPEKEIAFFHENARAIWQFSVLTFEMNNGTLSMYKKENPSQLVTVNDARIAMEIYSSAKKSGHTTWYQNILELGFKFYAFAAILVVGLIVLFYSFGIPWISDRVVELTPVEFDTTIGNTNQKQIESISEFDAQKSKDLQDFASYLTFETTRKLSFKVAKDDEVNAYALPNGTIIVNTGILDRMNTYEQLVALLGHEVTHVKERHSTQILARALSSYLIVSAVIGDVNGITTTIADNANQLNNLSYSRKFEESADAGSYATLKTNRVSASGMTGLFKILESKDGTEVPKIISTHPLTEDRLDFAEKMAEKKEYSAGPHPELEVLFNTLKNDEKSNN